MVVLYLLSDPNTVRLRVVSENYIGVETRRQSPQRGEPPHGAGSNFASLQELSVCKLSYPNRIVSDPTTLGLPLTRSKMSVKLPL